MTRHRHRVRLRIACALTGVVLWLTAALPTAQAPYRILLTNDDGVRAPGLAALVQPLQTVGEITIVAPAENQSGKGHSISITDPVYVDSVVLPGGIEALGATATPASCVKLALRALMSVRPDLVVSGINRGYNLGMASYVSGTVGAAREGALSGLPAIAASLDLRGGVDYAAAAEVVARLAAMIKADGLPPGVFLNVNVPAGTLKGTRVATQSRLAGEETWTEHRNPRGRRYFWNDYKDSETDVKGTDVWTVSQGYAAVTPLRAGEFAADAARSLRNKVKR
jgi:5'-nucleotidase